MKASHLGEQGFGNLAWDMNKMVATHTDEKVNELLGILDNQPSYRVWHRE